MNNKKLILISPLIIVILFACYLLLTAQTVHAITDWLAGIGIIAVWLSVILKFSYPSKKEFNPKTLPFIYILNASAVTLTIFMYFLHDFFNFSTVNNDLCDIGWNVVTLFWGLCIMIDWDIISRIEGKE